MAETDDKNVELSKEDIVKLLGIKVKSVGGEINTINGHGTSKNEREWYIISRIDNIYTLLSDFKDDSNKRLAEHIKEAECRYLTKDNAYKLVVCTISVISLAVMYFTK